MLLAQGRVWRLALSRGRDGVALSLEREALPDELNELRDLRMEIPLARWNTVVKQAELDRKLLGGVLLDFATPKDHVSAVVGNDRLLAELQRVIRDATVTLVESGLLILVVPEGGES